MSTGSHPTSESTPNRRSTTNNEPAASGTFSEATQRAIDEQRELEHKNWLLRFIEWLRIGYPAAVPDGDAGAIMYVLKQDLREEDIDRIAATIVAKQDVHRDQGEPITEQEINRYIETTMSQTPTEDDLVRVRTKLRDGGFDVAGA
ncbi:MULTISPECIES: DUF3349 domain-containing protein [Corynebacterium]|uniref:DUF3349 domain-containing protein n=1 Tax=Corynebacterium TaxID=1716 RepID=UPI00195C4F77|nr:MULTISPECIES: DUF3349 domain-containing protein [Corynebacterium]MDN8624676.1 DUF3349 domain-containing protein [Corynebacterium kroppenstedtii]QRQ65701.1 DUF3349 domain-containing protein [Corynebacterium kroppenstedtii]